MFLHVHGLIAVNEGLGVRKGSCAQGVIKLDLDLLLRSQWTVDLIVYFVSYRKDQY